MAHSRPIEQSSNAPPQPTGELLVALPRTSRQGAEQELRLVLDEYKGHPYIAVRLWQRDIHGGWRPLKDQGCSIRLGEVEEAVQALTLAVNVVEERREIERLSSLATASGTPRRQASGDVGRSKAMVRRAARRDGPERRERRRQWQGLRIGIREHGNDYRQVRSLRRSDRLRSYAFRHQLRTVAAVANRPRRERRRGGRSLPSMRERARGVARRGRGNEGVGMSRAMHPALATIATIRDNRRL